jgi:transketolase
MDLYLSPEKEQKLRALATGIRMSIIDMLEDAKSGHTAGPLGMADIFTAMYFHILRHDPKKPNWEDRDRLILSGGHIVPVRYATMAHAGYFPLKELSTLRQFGSRLQGHPERTRLPGLETTSGPLGSGLSQAAGIAYAGRMDDKKFFTYVTMGDGELQAGNVWEGAMFAGAHKLSRLIGIIDRNYIQINGKTEDVMPLNPLADKWKSFGWNVLEVDGHNIQEFVSAVSKAHASDDKPTMIVAHTIAGKGIPEIEYDHAWHGKAPSTEQEKRWLKDLRTLKGSIEASHHA